MQREWNDIADLLVDPVDRTPLSRVAGGDELVGGDGRRYPIVDGQPMLLAPDGRTASGWSFPPIATGQHAAIRARLSVARRLIGAVKRRLRTRSPAPIVELIAEHLPDLDGEDERVALIVGGGTVGHGAAELGALERAQVVSFDVYPSAATTFVADAHQIPLADGSVHAVWIQAVLEHVAQPAVVVDEIARVLAPRGVVYAETPFLQPVHEGPFDFQRYSVSGHRLLFAGFDEVVAGPLGGPGAMAALACRGVAGGLARSQRVARLAYAATAWMSLIDRFVPVEWRSDYATGAYFLGVRGDPTVPRDFDAISYYRGAQ